MCPGSTDALNFKLFSWFHSCYILWGDLYLWKCVINWLAWKLQKINNHGNLKSAFEPHSGGTSCRGLQFIFLSLCKFAWSKLTLFCTFLFFTTSRTPFTAWSSSATFGSLVFLPHYVWAFFAFIGSFQIERDSKHSWILIEDGTFLNQIKPHLSAFNVSFTYLLLALLLIRGLQSG